MIKCYEIWSNSLVWMCSCLSVGYIKYYKIWWLLKIGYQGYKKYNHSRLPWGKALKQSDDFQAMCEPPANIFAWRPQKANYCDGPGLFWTDKLTLGMANCVFFSSFSIYNFRSDQVWHLPRSSNFKLQISASVLFFFSSFWESKGRCSMMLHYGKQINLPSFAVTGADGAKSSDSRTCHHLSPWRRVHCCLKRRLQ